MDMDVRFPYSPMEVATVRCVQFGILSADEIVIPFQLYNNSSRLLRKHEFRLHCSRFFQKLGLIKFVKLGLRWVKAWFWFSLFRICKLLISIGVSAYYSWVFVYVYVQRDMSVAKIEHPQVLDGKGKPMRGGLGDLRLGTTDRRISCETCTGNMADCPGHFGHIELARPMYHIGFLKTVVSILRCVCFNCSKLLVNEVLYSMFLSYWTLMSFNADWLPYVG